ncbi:hypothetical protein WBP06_22920 [Novosphingobium sp. BL-8H]
MRVRPAVRHRRRGQEQQAQHQCQQYAAERHILRRSGKRIEQIANEAQQHAQDHQWVQADQAKRQEFAHRHPIPAIVIGIADHEAGQGKEEIHGQRRVMENHFRAIPEHRDALDVEQDDQHRRGSAKAVQHFEMGFSRGRPVVCRGGIAPFHRRHPCRSQLPRDLRHPHPFRLLAGATG